MPFVAADTQHGSYLVVWHDQGGSDANIYGRYLDAQGRPQGTPLAISTARGDQLRPSAAYVPTADAFLVVWQDDRYSSRLFTDIVGRIVDAAGGTTVSKEIAVAVLPDYQYSPVVAFNPASKEYLVVWDDDISAHRVSRAGEPLGNRIRVSLESPHQYKPSVAVTAEGTYLVVWEDLRNLGRRGADVYGQWLSAAGLPLGVNFALSSDPHNQYSPAVVAGQGWGPSDFFVIWEDDRTGGAILSLYGQWLSRGAAGN